jgi:hypothetical protein
MTAAKGLRFQRNRNDSLSHKYFNGSPFLFSMNKNVREKMQLSFRFFYENRTTLSGEKEPKLDVVHLVRSDSAEEVHTLVSHRFSSRERSP